MGNAGWFRKAAGMARKGESSVLWVPGSKESFPGEQRISHRKQSVMGVGGSRGGKKRKWEEFQWKQEAGIQDEEEKRMARTAGFGENAHLDDKAEMGTWESQPKGWELRGQPWGCQKSKQGALDTLECQLPFTLFLSAVN